MLTLVGTVTGVGWSTLGVYLSSLLFSHDASAAYAVKTVFLAIALLVHGFLRLYSPRPFISVFLLINVCVVNVMGTLGEFKYIKLQELSAIWVELGFKNCPRSFENCCLRLYTW